MIKQPNGMFRWKAIYNCGNEVITVPSYKVVSCQSCRYYKRTFVEDVAIARNV